jgi:hypothetical protein
MDTERWSDDASFYDILLELWALEEYINILEVELPSLIEKERHRLYQGLKAGDEQELYYTEIAEHQLDDGITTRLITGSAMVATWATFESAVQQTAGSLEPRRNRNSVLDQAEKLFERLGIQYSSRIKDLYALRNALVHANGRVEDIGLDSSAHIQLKKRLEIKRLVNSSSGYLRISHDGYLIVSIEFVRGAFEFIEPLLRDLAKQTDRELPDDGVSDKHPIEQSG